jgi:hypothetical protein
MVKRASILMKEMKIFVAVLKKPWYNAGEYWKKVQVVPIREVWA